MAPFDDDADPAGGSGDEFENEDEEMEDVDDADRDQDQDQGGYDDGGEDEDDDDNDDNEGDNEDDDDEDQNEQESPSRRASRIQRSASRDRLQNPEVVLTSPSPRTSAARSPSGAVSSIYIPPVRPEALTAQAYDIVPTMAAPQGTSINAITSTPDIHWVFSGGSDGYVRMFNWVETANGKVPLTVAQKHPFVDSVMKAGSLITYWENEESSIRTPSSQSDESKWTSPVYSLAVQHQALWLLSGLESGGINLQTCRHQAGTRIMTLKEHTSAVSVLQLARDETSVLSGSWDKMMYDWDMNTGKVKRSFKGSSGQISAIEIRPLSDVPVPEVTETVHESLGTFSSNNADKPLTNGVSSDNGRQGSKNGEEDALGSPSGSLFGEDHGSLFGEETAVGGGNAFGDDDEDLTRALADELQEPDADVEVSQDAEMGGMGSGGPVQPPGPAADIPGLDGTSELPNGDSAAQQPLEEPADDQGAAAQIVLNGLPHSDEPLTAPPTGESSKVTSTADLTPQSESTFLNAAFDGTIRIWDKRMQTPIANIQPYGGTPPWCTGACWSPDGNFIYAGRRNCSVDEYSIHKLGSSRGKPERTFRFQQGSGAVYAVRAMPNGRHLVW